MFLCNDNGSQSTQSFQHAREFFPRPTSSSAELSNDSHAHMFDINKLRDTSLAETNDFVSNLHDHDPYVSFGDTSKVSAEHVDDF